MVYGRPVRIQTFPGTNRGTHRWLHRRPAHRSPLWGHQDSQSISLLTVLFLQTCIVGANCE